MEKLIKKYKNYKKELNNYYYAVNILAYDSETDCPKNGQKYSLDIQNFFKQKAVDIETSEDYKKTIKALYKAKDKLDEFLKLQIEEEFKELEKLESIPKELLFKHFENMNKAFLEWSHARDTIDYSNFEKELEELIEYNKKYTGFVPKKGLEPYDILLNDYEEDFTVKKYDEFFNLLKSEIVPLVKTILKMEPLYNKEIESLTFSIDKQKKLTQYICKLMNYTDKTGCVRETIHPFTNAMHINDVRITTNYSENQLFSNIFSVMHEVGHALYELGQDQKLDGTSLFGGASLAIHESQSRFYENYLGRSKEFIHFLYPILKKYFEKELKDITEDDVYYYVNSVSNQFIRTEADELTYSIHILIRYEIEKKLFRNEITVYEIDKTFNDLFYEYFEVRPKNKLEGCFQDVHWSSNFGYFPTYALGNAFAAQFLNAMKKDINVFSLMEQGNFKPINDWLDDKIHKYGKSKKNTWLVKNASGEDFNPKYYIDYLKNKFIDIYGLNK